MWMSVLYIGVNPSGVRGRAEDSEYIIGNANPWIIRNAAHATCILLMMARSAEQPRLELTSSALRLSTFLAKSRHWLSRCAPCSVSWNLEAGSPETRGLGFRRKDPEAWCG